MATSCKLNVILDIDETFVYFIADKYRSYSWDILPEKEKAKYTTLEANKGIYIVRPHIEEFMDFLFKNCTVSIWTWSDANYARFVADTFVLAGHPERKMRLLLSEAHAEESGEIHGNSKDLNWIWYDQDESCFAECNTVLIDDLPSNSVHTSNSKNSITIAPFALFGEVKDRSDPYLDVSKDTSLLDVIALLKKVIPHVGDCYNEETRWNNIFSEENIARMGIQSYLKTVQLDSKKGRKMVRAIGVGPSHLFVGGKTRKRLRNRRNTRNRRRRNTRK